MNTSINENQEVRNWRKARRIRNTPRKRKKKQETALAKAVHVAAMPVHLISNGLHKVLPHNTRVSHVVIGMTFMATGSAIAIFAPEHVHDKVVHVVIDTGAYGLHGLGAAPIIKLVAEFLKIEV